MILVLAAPEPRFRQLGVMRSAIIRIWKSRMRSPTARSQTAIRSPCSVAVHRLTPDGDAVLHAPSAPARSQAELIAAASELLGERERRPLVIPRLALRVLAPLSTFAREPHGIVGLWYSPSVLHAGVLTTQEGLQPTSWEDALGATAQAALAARDAARGTRPVTV